MLTVAGRRLIGSARVALVPATAALAAAVLLLLPLASVDVDGWALDVPAVRLSSLPAALSLGDVRLASAARDGAVTAAVAALPMVPRLRWRARAVPLHTMRSSTMRSAVSWFAVSLPDASRS